MEPISVGSLPYKEDVMPNYIYITLTDTFNGEANFAWVRNHSSQVKGGESTATIVRRAKRLAGVTKLRHRTEEYADEIRLYFLDSPMVLFIEWCEGDV